MQVSPKFNPKFQITFDVDDETGDILAAYFRIREGKVHETVEYADGRVNADYDRSGQLLGIEILAPCPLSVLDSIVKSETEPVRRFLQKSPPRALVG